MERRPPASRSLLANSADNPRVQPEQSCHNERCPYIEIWEQETSRNSPLDEAELYPAGMPGNVPPQEPGQGIRKLPPKDGVQGEPERVLGDHHAQHAGRE